MKIAGFPFLKRVEDYDFNFQPSISKEKIYSIIQSNFYDDGTNILLVGNLGTGKRHLAIAIAYSVAITSNIVFEKWSTILGITVINVKLNISIYLS